MRRVLSLCIGSLLILAGASVAFSTVLAVFMLPPRFSSAARIAPGVTDTAGIATEIQKIQSQSFRQQVVSNLDLTRRWAEKFKEPEMPLAVASLLLKKDLAVRRSGDTHLIEIRIESDTPEEASSIANVIAEMYRDSALAPKGPDGKSAVQIIDKAQPNLRPASPNKPRAIATGCAIGAVLAIIGIWLIVGAVRHAKPVPARRE